jgi:serine palmitoyltransferase
MCDVIFRTITDVPGRIVHLLERKRRDWSWKLEYTGNIIPALNLSSYNYLGLANNQGPCADAVHKKVLKYGINLSAARMDCGTSILHRRTEKLMAQFLCTILS